MPAEQDIFEIALELINKLGTFTNSAVLVGITIAAAFAGLKLTKKGTNRVA